MFEKEKVNGTVLQLFKFSDAELSPAKQRKQEDAYNRANWHHLKLVFRQIMAEPCRCM